MSTPGKFGVGRPGHETFPIYKQPEVQKILDNTTRWLATKPTSAVAETSSPQ